MFLIKVGEILYPLLVSVSFVPLIVVPQEFPQWILWLMPTFLLFHCPKTVVLKCINFAGKHLQFRPVEKRSLL